MRVYFNIYDKNMKILTRGTATGSSVKKIEADIAKSFSKTYKKPFYVDSMIENPVYKATYKQQRRRSGIRSAPAHYYRPTSLYRSEDNQFRHRPRVTDKRGNVHRPVIYTKHSHMLSSSPGWGYRSRKKKKRKNPHPSAMFEDAFGTGVGWLQMPAGAMESKRRSKKRK